MALPKWLLLLSANIHVSKYPMWIQYKPSLHKTTGADIQKFISTVKVGDLVFRRHDGYLNTYFTPGFWGHVGIVVSPSEVIHAIEKGVVKELLLDFCRTDHMCVARFKKANSENIQYAVSTANTLLGLDYDYEFETTNSAYYCTELIDFCYKNVFAPYYTKQAIGSQKVLLPSDIADCGLLDILLDIRK